MGYAMDYVLLLALLLVIFSVYLLMKRTREIKERLDKISPPVEKN